MAWTPQRLPELMPTTIPTEVKLQEAANVAEALAVRYLDDDKSRATVRNLQLDSGLHRFALFHVSRLCCTVWK